MNKPHIIKIAGYMYQLNKKNLLNYFKVTKTPKNDEIVNNSIHWVGHATTIINLDGNMIITDPVMEMRLGHMKRKIKPSVSGDRLKTDYILLSHGHMDHINYASLKKLNKNSILLCPVGFKNKLESIGFKNVYGIKPGETFKNDSVKITAILSVHNGSRYYFTSEKTSISYLIKGKTKTVLFVCDTALTSNFDDIKADVVIMPVGCYKPDEFQKMHCSPEQGFQMFKKMNASFMLPVHYNTFILAQDNDADTISSLEGLNDGSIKILEVGETLKL